MREIVTHLVAVLVHEESALSLLNVFGCELSGVQLIDFDLKQRDDDAAEERKHHHDHALGAPKIPAELTLRDQTHFEGRAH